MKADIRGRQKQSGGLSEDEKQATSACKKRSDDDCLRQDIRRDPSWNQQWHLSISCKRAKRAQAGQESWPAHKSSRLCFRVSASRCAMAGEGGPFNGASV